VLAGPESDPAGVKQCGTLSSALLAIWELGAEGAEGVKWHARNDDSATMWKERSLWDMADDGLKPWDTKACGNWYQMSVCTPAEAIQRADLDEAYLLTDRATLLRQTALGAVGRTTVFFEPGGESDVLMNSCYALFSSEKGEGSGHRDAFLKYMVGERGQEVVESFGVEAGLALFAGVKAGLSRRHLRGGIPRGGKWVVPQ
jgi:tungstate transport system substrate-binding protein